MSLMARVDQARGRLQASTEQLSGARGLLNSNLGGESGEIGDGFSSFFKRLWQEASDTWDSITNPDETLKGAWAGLQEAEDDPGQALEEAWNGLKAPFEDIKEDWDEGREEEAIGQGLAEVVLLASPTKFFKGLKGLGALGGDGDDAPDSPDASTGSSRLPGSGPSDDEPPGSDPPSSDSDGPIDDPPGGDPPAAGSDESDDESDDDNNSGNPDNSPGDSILTSERRDHILDGDGRGGGGHGPGRGVPGKSEFPSHWSDEQTIEHIEDVATNPNSTYRRQDGGPRDQYYDRNGDPVRFVVEGVRDGVKIRVITEPAGEGIITAFPPDIPRNP
jgi:hypothetical protein